MRSLISSFVSRYWFSDECINKKQARALDVLKALRQEKKAQVFLALDVPYSYLLIQVLPLLVDTYDLEFQLHLIHNRQQDMFPESEMWSNYALKDAAHLKTLYNLDLPKVYPSTQQITLAQEE